MLGWSRCNGPLKVYDYCFLSVNGDAVVLGSSLQGVKIILTAEAVIKSLHISSLYVGLAGLVVYSTWKKGGPIRVA